jgi:adenylate cyclase
MARIPALQSDMKHILALMSLVLILGLLPAVDPVSGQIAELLSLAGKNLKTSADKSVEYAGKALALAQQNGLRLETARAELILAKGYHAAGVADKALERCQQALRGFEVVKDRAGQADALEQMGFVYWKLQDGNRVKDCFTRSMEIREDLGDLNAIANALNNIGIFTLHYLGEPDKALEFYQRALSISREQHYEMGEANALNNIGNYYMMRGDLANSMKFNEESLALYRKIGDLNKVAVNLLIIGYLHQMNGEEQTALDCYRETLDLAKLTGSPGIARDTYLNLSLLYEDRHDELNHLRYYKLYSDSRDSLASQESNRNIANLQTQFAIEKQELQNRLLNVTLAKQRQLLAGLAALLLLGLAATLFIIREKRRSERLLLNILPKITANELKRDGSSPPRTFDEATVLFSDLVDFTSSSAGLAPAELIAELNDLFTAFDNIVEANGCERIKTIGDAYLAVCGIPETRHDHAARLTRVALGMTAFLDERNRTAKHVWRIRIGLHSGPAVGGIVGVKKYIYDVFGDSINTASRMESNSEPMRVNVSEAVWVRISDWFEGELRPAREIKGKGEMRMYFVTSEKEKCL